MRVTQHTAARTPETSRGARASSALRALSVVCAAAFVVGCAGLSDDLRRARRSYAAAAYEDANTWLAAIEEDIPSANTAQRATWHYLRGMTEYRLGHRREARHYLALAHVIAGERGVGLQPQWQRTLAITLDELGDEIPGGGTRRGSRSFGAE